jgi:hypothetical protein
MFKKNFRHVFVAVKYGQCVLVLEDSLTGFRTNVMTVKDFKDLTKQEKWNLIRVVKGERAPKKFSIWFWAPTCVNFVKNVLGLRCKAQTPYQLYNYLLSEECKKWAVKLKR